MKFLNRFKKNSPTVEEPSFSQEEINCWPSVPNEQLQVPGLEMLIEKSSFSKEAEQVKKWAAEGVEEGDEVNFQVPMNSQYGRYCIPALVKRKDGGFLVYYSHCSEWNEDALAGLLNWAIKLRNSDFVHTLKIEICQSPDALPDKVREIISKRTEHRMLISMIPLLSREKPDMNARVFAEGFGFFFNEKKILNYDKESLHLVEDWYRKTVRSCVRESFYYQFYTKFLGAYLGKVVIQETGGEWTNDALPKVMVADPLKITFDPFGIAADFIFNPGLENSPVKNLELLVTEINRHK